MGYYENLIGKEKMFYLFDFLMKYLHMVAFTDGQMDEKEVLSIGNLILSPNVNFVSPVTRELLNFL